MIRTQIYLPEDLHEALKEKSREEKITMAQIIRKSLEKDVRKKKKKAKFRGAEALLKLAEMAEKEGWSGPPDLSINADRYLYGDKSHEWGYLYKKPKRKKKR